MKLEDLFSSETKQKLSMQFQFVLIKIDLNVVINNLINNNKFIHLEYMRVLKSRYLVQLNRTNVINVRKRKKMRINRISVQNKIKQQQQQQKHKEYLSI